MKHSVTMRLLVEYNTIVEDKNGTETAKFIAFIKARGILLEEGFTLLDITEIKSD